MVMKRVVQYPANRYGSYKCSLFTPMQLMPLYTKKLKTI